MLFYNGLKSGIKAWVSLFVLFVLIFFHGYHLENIDIMTILAGTSKVYQVNFFRIGMPAATRVRCIWYS